MKRIHVTTVVLGFLVIGAIAGNKEQIFAGSTVYFNDESSNITVKSGKKEMSFFVVGKITRGGTKISINDLQMDCPLTVTYQKNKNRLVATRVEADVCEKQ